MKNWLSKAQPVSNFGSTITTSLHVAHHLLQWNTAYGKYEARSVEEIDNYMRTHCEEYQAFLAKKKKAEELRGKLNQAVKEELKSQLAQLES